jgi:diguanylate cyclase
MAAHSAAKLAVDVIEPSDEEKRLREQVKKLFRQLDTLEQEVQRKEEVLKQASGLLVVLARSAAEEEVRPLLDQLSEELKKDLRPATLALLVEDIKKRVIQRDLSTTESQTATDQEAGEKSASSPAPPPEFQLHNGKSEKSKVATSGPGRSTTAVETSSGSVLSEHYEREIENNVRTVLSSLVEYLHVEGQKELYEKISAVKVALTEGGLLRRLADVRLQLADLLDCYRKFHDGERSRLEDVLKELISKLAEIEKNVVAGLLESHKEAMADNAQFAERLEGQVMEMQEAAQLKDLEGIRQAIANRTERMHAAIRAKRKADAELSASFEAKVRSLERQLHDANRELSNMTERAYHDPFLEGVYNRRAFTEKLHQEISRFQRYQHPVSLLLFDMDHFKHVNDAYGHQAGDFVLQTLAARVRPVLRTPDLFARFGGDEFALVLPQTSLPGAVIVAERLRAIVYHSQFVFETHTLPVSLSMGVATVRPGDTVDTLLARADQALYLAKEKGRNQVRSEEELPLPLQSTLDKMVGFFARTLPFRKGKGE